MTDERSMEYRVVGSLGAAPLANRAGAMAAYNAGCKVECLALKNGKPIPPPTWMPWSPKPGEI